MADILFWEGAEGYQSYQDLRDKWIAHGAVLGNGLQTDTRVRTGAKGTRSFTAYNNQSSTDFLTVANLATVMVEFWVSCASLNSSDCLYITDSSGNNHFKLTRTSASGAHTWRCFDANSAQVGVDFTMASLNWFHVGIKLTVGNSGTLTVRFDDNVWINNVTGDFQTGSATTVGRIGFFLNSGAGAGTSINFDDLVIQGVAGTFLGSNVHCVAAFPTAAGDSTQWTPSAGSNYQNVDEPDPNDETDYNSSSTSSHLDLYNVTDLPAYSGTVLGVDVWARMKKDPGAVVTAKVATKTNSVVYYGSDTALNNSYAPYRKQYLVNPNTGIAWTQAEVNALQLGAQVV